MESKKLTRRERQAELLKKEILEAAVKVFKQYGYEKATTKKIAEKAEVSEGTLYYYFENKRDILITLFKILIENITNNLANVSAGNKEKVSSEKDDIASLLSKGMVRQYSQINTLPILTLFLHEAKLDPYVQEIFSQMMVSVRELASNLFKHLEKEGKIRKINHESMAVLMSLIGIGYMSLFEIGDSKLSAIPLKKLTDEFSYILAHGIMPVNKKDL